jgi:hypothetical protein
MVRRGFQDGIKVVDSGPRVLNARNELQSKQVSVLFRNKATQKRLVSDADAFEKFVNEQIVANKPERKRGKRIQWKVDVSHRDYYKGQQAKFDMHYDTKDFRSMNREFSLDELTLSNHYHNGSEAPEDVFQLNIGDDVNKLHRKFRIIYRYVDKEGGFSRNNECFLNCLKEKLGDYIDESLYRQIVPKGKMTQIKVLPAIEDALKINICVPSYYKSEMKHDKTVHMTLFDNHYELVVNIRNQIKVKPLREFENRRIVLHKGLEVLELTKDGFSKRECTLEQYKSYRRRNKIKNIWLAQEDNLTEEMWHHYNEFEQILRRRFNTSFTQYGSLAEFAYYFWLKIEEPELLSLSTLEDEQIFEEIRNSSSSIVYMQPKLDKTGFVKYDSNSEYPSQLNNSQIPLTPPRYGLPSCEYTEPCFDPSYGLEFFLRFKEQGWYHVEITDEERKKESPPRFTNSKSGYYWCEEIIKMQHLRYKFKLTEKRAIIFPSYTVRGSIFMKWNKVMYALKQETKNPVVKRVYNCLLGFLAKKNQVALSAFSNADLILRDGEEVVDAKAKQISVKKYTKPTYKFAPWVQWWVYAKTRMKMNALMDEVGRGYVVEVLTDCVVVKPGHAEPANQGQGLGQWKKQIMGD